MKVYDKDDHMFAVIKSAADPNHWYADRIGLKFPLSRTDAGWDHIKVSLGGVESQVYHGDYEMIYDPPKVKPKKNLLRKTRYYEGDKCIWVAESPDIPDKIVILQAILFLAENGYGDVTRYEVQLDAR